MEKEFFNIQELSQYLNIRQSTLYVKVKTGILPHYRIGRLIRFRKADIDRYLQCHKRDPVNVNVIEILTVNKSVSYVDRVIRKAIDEVKGLGYNPVTGKPDQVKGLRKEGDDGAL